MSNNETILTDMKNIQDLIPMHKDDIETADKLKHYSYSEIKPIIPQLSGWLQDMNWPIARPVADYLEQFTNHISSDIVTILKGDDEMWKYWIIGIFGPLSKDSCVLNEIRRIAFTPAQSEINNETDGRAREILEELDS